MLGYGLEFLISFHMRITMVQSKAMDFAVPLPPQCAHWGTFPPGEGIGRGYSTPRRYSPLVQAPGSKGAGFR